MLYRSIMFLSILTLIISTNTYSDTLIIEDFEQHVETRILEMNEEYVKAVIPRKTFNSMSIKSKSDDEYPDTVFMNFDGKEYIMNCKIMKITKKPCSITLKIPREKVVAMQIDFPVNQYDTDARRTGYSSSLSELKKESPVYADTLKEQIKEELTREFEEKQKQDELVIGERIQENLALEFEKKQQIKEEKYETENFGKVSGCMLKKGRQLRGCQVKIALLEKWGLFGKPSEGVKFETITDEDGSYYFEKVLPGGYKMYWKPPDETSWIRSIKMEPDFFIETGETYKVPDRETNIRTVN